MQRKSAPETCNSREQSSKLCTNQNLNLSNKLEITAEEIGVGFSGLRQFYVQNIFIIFVPKFRLFETNIVDSFWQNCLLTFWLNKNKIHFSSTSCWIQLRVQINWSSFSPRRRMTCEDFTAADLKAAGGTMLAPGAGAGGIGGTWWTWADARCLVKWVLHHFCSCITHSHLIWVEVKMTRCILGLCHWWKKLWPTIGLSPLSPETETGPYKKMPKLQAEPRKEIPDSLIQTFHVFSHFFTHIDDFFKATGWWTAWCYQI